jgi:hypothetical protein
MLRATGLEIASYSSAAEKIEKTKMGFTLERRRMIIGDLDAESANSSWR